jgi:endonuclease I
MKKIISLLAFSVLAISACSEAPQDLGLMQDNFNQVSEFSSQSKLKNNIRTDWFETLSPELQSYYAPAKDKTGVQLFDALHSIISQNNHIKSYEDSKSYMYAISDNQKINGTPGLFDAYSYIFVSGTGGNGGAYKERADENHDGAPNDFINCEHTWPQSFFDKKLPMVGDMHHLFPTLSVPNNMRGHFPFGPVQGTVVYTTSGGSKLGMADKTGKQRSLTELQKIINLPYEQKSVIMDRDFTNVFEPGDKQKGNTSRALLYFYLRYYDQNIKSGEFEQNAFWNSKVSNFINWDENVDPVDEHEKARNEIIFKKQGNRNPFIDIPNLATLIGEDVLKSK